jgi:transketolase
MNKKQNIPKSKSVRDGFGEALLELGKKNQNIVVVSADLAESTRVQWFAKKFPQRFIEVGVAEQNAMGVAAGLALGGLTPFVASFAVFSPGRNWDQLRISVCYSKTNVKIASTHIGLAVGADGASHQALEDLTITRCLPNLTIITPVDYLEAKKATMAATKIIGPVYLRLSRQNSPLLTTKNSTFQVGRANILHSGKDITLVGCGPILAEALLAAEDLKTKNVSLEIINCHTAKPLDDKTILRSVKKTGRLITLEDHQVMGGLGSAVVEMLAENYPVPTKMLGVHDSFGESGTIAELWDKYGLDRYHIAKAALQLMLKK